MNEYQKHELETLEEEKSGFFPLKDLEGLNWTFRKISALQARIKEIEDVAKLEVERVEKWRKSQTEALESDVNFFSEQVKIYHANELANDPKRKSIKTPFGTAKSTTRKASLEAVDKSVLLEYAKSSAQEYVKTEVKESVDWAALKGKLHIVEKDDGLIVIDEDGQLVDGVAVKPAETTFKLEVE